MPKNIQEFAQSASGYKELTLNKHLSKKRGRACTRRDKRRSSIESRIIRDKLAASFANREFRKEMKQFEKTVQEASARGIHDIPMPEFLAELKATAALAEGNLSAARVSQAAMAKYPPLS